MNKSTLQDLFILFVLYTISSMFIILNFDGLYWDDWVTYNQSIETMKVFIKNDFNNDLFYYFYFYMHSIGNGILVYRTFIFLSFFLSGLAIYFVLKKIKELDPEDTFYITLLYLLMPVFSARIAISVIPFFAPVLLFYLSFFTLSKYLENNLFFLRPVVLFGFFVSFYTNSLLVFYALVLIYIFYVKYNFCFTRSNIKSFALRYMDFIVLPVIFFIVKSLWFKATGLYEGYNALSELSILNTILILLKSFHTSIFDVLHQALYISFPFWPLLLVIVAVRLKQVEKQKIETEVNPKSILFFLLGLVIFLLAVFPYAAVAKPPNVESFASRAQLLIPLGLAFIFYFGINIIVKYFKLKYTVKIALLSVLVFSFMGKNINDYLKFQIDSLYMTSIVMNFKDNPVIQNNTTFIVNNTIQDKLMYKRWITYYEWNGLLKQAFNNSDRLMIHYEELENLNELKKLQVYPQYNFLTWKESRPIVVTISRDYENLIGGRKILRLSLLRYQDYEKYLTEVKILTKIITSEVK